MKTVLRLLASLLVLVLLAWFGIPLYLARSVAAHEGAVAAAVSAPVEIAFDAKGIPQVWARTDGDAWFAMGWLHASDRLFQMELIRRLARGELSEVFGEAAFETDTKQRRLGFARRADAGRLTPSARRAIEKYVAGVNAWVAQASPLPPEFVLLRFRPRPWTPEDCIAVAGYQTWFAHELMDQDRAYQKAAAALGAAGIELTKAGHPWSPPTVPETQQPGFVADVLGATGLRISAASNSWVVSPSRSSTGAALHAADPHLAIDQAPGLWYLAGIHSGEGLNVVGATYAGSPFVVMGHNGAIAYSFTVAGVDLIDYFDDRPRATRLESIVVKGEKVPRVVEVQEGSRGVMIEPGTSLRWAGFDFPPVEIVNSAVRLQRAANFDEFRRAVTGFGALDVNWVYSDRQGNIGYQLGAPVPIRGYDTFRRQRADDPRAVWEGYRPLEETPHVLNPARGYLASCNNRVVGETWPYELPGFYDPYRITRAMALLPDGDTPEEMRAMQLDLVSGLSLRWKALAAEGARAAGLQDAAGALERWDGAMRHDSREAALFAFWWRSMSRHVFEDDLGKEWEVVRSLLDRALTLRSALVDDRRTRGVEAAGEIAARAMRDAHSLAGGRTWGEACTLRIRHPLAQSAFLDRWLDLSRGTFPSAGDPGSLLANFHRYDRSRPGFRTTVGPSMRFVLDWSDLDAFALTGALGQSGNPFSDHYDDFLETARKGEAWNVPFSRAKVWERKTSLLVLEPGQRTSE